MSQRLDPFVSLSALLTGFDAVQLYGTGLAEAYLDELDQTLPAGFTDQLLAQLAPVSADPAPDEALERRVMADFKLGPVARTLVVLWYTGGWTPLPDAWRAEFGASPRDVKRVISAESYQGGLQWQAAGAHPPGALHQGFAAWALPPRELSA